MDFFHASIGHISRSTGRSAVQNVAYITGETLREDRREILADYANNRGAFWETLAPPGSGITSDDLSFWNKLESFEDGYARQRFKNPASLERYLTSARTGQTYELALPKELRQAQHIDLIRDLVLDRFVSRGLLATYAIHDDEGNPHVHITVSNRTVWNGEISWGKSVSRHLTSQIEFRESRRIFAEFINKHQELAGISDRVDHRSYADRGIELIPTFHKGYQAHQLEKDGFFSRIAAGNQNISEENKERIAEEPRIILAELTDKQATFSERDVVKLVQKRMRDDSNVLSSHVIHAVMKQAVLVGVGFDDIKRYTSVEYKAKEDYILDSFKALIDKKSSFALDAPKVDGRPPVEGRSSVDTLLQGEASWLNEGQKEAVKTLCGNRAVSVMIGRAGTGKTTALQYVVRLHEEAGCRVLGMAPSATAAYELRKGAGCDSDTVARYAYAWKTYHQAVENRAKAVSEKDKQRYEKMIKKYEAFLPDKNTLVLVDEAGMVGVGDVDGRPPADLAGARIAGGWDAIIKTVNATGCKLILVGDDHQFKPVEAGDVLRKFIEILRTYMAEARALEIRSSETSVPETRASKERSALCELTVIQRQTVPWMREASLHLSELRAGTALGMYEQQGHLQEHETDAQVYQDIARQYLRNLSREPDSEILVMAYTNGEVQALNGAIRRALKENGLLPQKDLLAPRRQESGGRNQENSQEANSNGTYVNDKDSSAVPLAPGGPVGYTVGDKIVFTQNDRGFWTKFKSADPFFFVRNGTQAVIESIRPCWVEDRETTEIHDTYEIIATVGGKDTRVVGGVLREKATVSFYLCEYAHFQHGYAVTTHKSQGATVDGALLKLSRYMDAHAFYVAMTRHRNDIGIYYSKEDFSDFQSLLKTAGKISVKDLAVDYSIAEENEASWNNIQEYKTLGYELLSISAFGKSADKSNKAEQEKIWSNYRNIQEERKGLAKLILDEWDTHKDFIRQARLTLETFEIAAGLRKRPLSLREVQAQVVVEQYASVAIETRHVWHTIRRTHPGSQAKTHPEWNNFDSLRDQRGVLANQILQSPDLYRPFLKNAAKAFEADDGNNRFGYGLHIIKAQSEAHQSKMIQQGMLKDTSDPVLSERLQTLLNYVDARDLSASAWKELRPKLKQVEGTLLSKGFCKEIDAWKDMKKARDQLALKIVDSWEDYAPLIQKVGMKLSFETLMDQKEQAVRDTLLKTYATSEEDTRVGNTRVGESAKLHAAFEIKALMEEDKAAGKKATVAQVYEHGLQPKDIARDALEYQKLKVFDSLKTEPERQLFLLLNGYDDKCREANRIYVVCLNEVKEMNGNASGEASGKEEREVKPWDAPSWPVYQEACKPRNKIALEIFDRSDHAEVLVLADAMGLKLREVELEQVFSRGEKAFRDTHIETYLTSPTQAEKKESAFALTRLINSERERSKSDGKSESATAKQVYHAGIDFKELHQAANTYQQSRVLQTLTTEEDIKTFHALQSYGKATHLAYQAYKSCIEEAQGKSLNEKTVKPADTPVWETEAYKTYAPLAAAQNRIAYALFEEHDIEQMLDLSRQMGMSLDVSKFMTQVENGMRDFYLETFKETASSLVKAMSAAEIHGLLEADERQGTKKTFGALKGKGISASDVRDYAHQFNRLSMIDSLGTEAEKELFRLYSAYDYHAVVAKGIYRQCMDTRVSGQENLGIKVSESEHFPAYKETVSERNAAANALVQHPGYSKCLDLVERLGLTINRGHILSHGEDGFREQTLIRYKDLSQSPGAEFEGTHAEMRKAKVADLLVKMIGDDREEGHKKTLLAVYQAGLSPKDVFVAANEWKEFAVFATLDTQEERHIFGLVIKYKARSEKANGLYRQCAEDFEKLGVKVSSNTLYPDYLAAVSARNESATALLGSDDLDLCWDMAEALGVALGVDLRLDEDKLMAQSRDGQRQTLLHQYVHTDSILVKQLIARELKEMMDEDQKNDQKVTVADLCRNNILPKNIQEEARQFDRMVAYSNLTNDTEKRVFSLLDQYGDLLTQSNRHYSASFQEAEEQGVKKEKTASYALFQETLKGRQKVASVIQHTAKPTVIEGMAEDMGVPLEKLDKDRQAYDRGLSPKAKEEEAEAKVNPISSVPENSHPLRKGPTQDQPPPEVAPKEDKGVQLRLRTRKIDLVPEGPAPKLTTVDGRSSAELPKIDTRSSEGESIIDRESTLDLAAKGFISLSEKHEKTHWRYPQKDEIRQALDKLASKYWQDERFVSQIKSSGSEVAASNIRLEIHLLEIELSRSQYPVDRRPAQEDGHACPSSTGAASASLAKPTLREVEGIDMAAKEFVSLTERYEKVHWKDPERNTIRASLDKIVATHWQDERFVSTIESSGSELAASKIKIEIHLAETELSRSRQFDR